MERIILCDCMLINKNTSICHLTLTFFPIMPMQAIDGMALILPQGCESAKNVVRTGRL